MIEEMNSSMVIMDEMENSMFVSSSPRSIMELVNLHEQFVDDATTMTMEPSSLSPPPPRNVMELIRQYHHHDHNDEQHDENEVIMSTTSMMSTPPRPIRTMVVPPTPSRPPPKKRFVTMTWNTQHPELPMEFTYHQYIHGKLAMKLGNYTIPQLKHVIKYHPMKSYYQYWRQHRVPSRKEDIIHYIQRYFHETSQVLLLQKQIRGYFVRTLWKESIHGPAWKQRDSCVNDTDCYTLEPLRDISKMRFFSYLEVGEHGHGHAYGFDIHSLMQMYQMIHHANAFENPYTRIPFPIDIQYSMFRLYRILRLVCPTERLTNEPSYIIRSTMCPSHPRNRITSSSSSSSSTMTTTTTTTIGNTTTLTPRHYFQLITNVLHSIPQANLHHMPHMAILPSSLDTNETFTLTNYHMNTLVNLRLSNPDNILETIHYIERRQFDLATLSDRMSTNRIHELFMSMDQLDFYTSSSWMLELSRSRLIGLFRTLQDIWRQRRITIPLRHQICPVGNPFENAQELDDIMMRCTDEQLPIVRSICLDVMEPFIYSGIDIESRKLGAFYVLTAMTYVSTPARQQLFWLYESNL